MRKQIGLNAYQNKVSAKEEIALVKCKIAKRLGGQRVVQSTAHPAESPRGGSW